MRLHLPVSLRKSLLSCVVAAVASTYSCSTVWASSESAPQNLIFEGDRLTWNTNANNKAFTNAAGEAASFATGDNVSFASDATISLGEDISAGQINIASGADVVIELADNGLNFDTLSLLGGALDVGSSLNIESGETLAVGSNGAVLKSALVLEKNASLSVDYSGTGAATSLNNSSLSLQGDTQLQLSGCGNGDGKTYTLLTGVSELRDSQGNAISLGEGNNAISNYFDTTQPGTGFWGNSTLRLTSEGSLQLVLHNGTINPASEFTERHPEGATYKYYSSVAYRGITYSSGDNSYIYGGAVNGKSNPVELSYNGSVVFEGNEVKGTCAYGSAISGNNITLNNNGSVKFKGNTTSATHFADGGAIIGDNISLNNNGSVEFSRNRATGSSSVRGGAIFGNFWSITNPTITLRDNGNVLFCENSAVGSSAEGGAIFAYHMGILLINNDSVEFSGNTATSSHSSVQGGAICGYTNDIVLSGNGSVIFNKNSASSNNGDASGGAIYGAYITLSNNESVTFSENTASGSSTSYGGAIYASRNLNIRNNASVLFEKNAEVINNIYRLRSIYANGNGREISLSVAEGKNITFRDSIYIGSGCSFELNENYAGKEQQGDIIFTSATTADDLFIVKGNVDGSDAEIQASRTTEVNTMTNLYGGRLRVEDGAIYQGYGITAHEGSCATVLVKDAVLSHADYELHFYEGTKLEALGTSEIFGDVIVESTATAAFTALTRLEGSLTLVSGSTLLLDGEFTLDGTLTLGTGLTLGGNVLELLKQLQYGQSLTLVSGLDSLTVQSLNAKSTSEYSAFATDQELRAADYFSNLSPNMVLKYNGEVGSLSVSRVIPEPATTTLSLLALTALVSRRRRK